MKLNCDLGESFGAWSMPVEAAIMAEIDQANIAKLNFYSQNSKKTVM